MKMLLCRRAKTRNCKLGSTSAWTTETPTAVQTAGGTLLGILVEFSAGMELGHDDPSAAENAFALVNCRRECRRPSSAPRVDWSPSALSTTSTTGGVAGERGFVRWGVVDDLRRPCDANRSRHRCRRYTCPAACLHGIEALSATSGSIPHRIRSEWDAQIRQGSAGAGSVMLKPSRSVPNQAAQYEAPDYAICAMKEELRLSAKVSIYKLLNK